MSPPVLPVNGDEFQDIFPFHLAFGRDLQLVQVGRAWRRVLPDVAPGAAFPSTFRVVRPSIAMDFDALRAQAGALFVIECLPLGMALRGQLRLAGDGTHLLFLGSPWITDLDDLARFRLTLTDFPAHEPVSDYLFLIQSQKQALADAKALALALEQREGTLRAVLDTAAEGIITIDARGIVKSFNAAAGRIFGYRPSEVVGQNVAILMPQPHRDAHDGYLAAYLETGDARVIGKGREVPGRRKDGSAVLLDLAVSDVVYGDDRLFTGIVRDLTEQHSNLTALRESRELLHQTLSAAHAGVWEWDFTTARARWSDETYRMFGLEPGTPLTSERFFELFHVADRPRIEADIRGALAGRGPLEGEHRVVWGDGSIRWIRNVGSIERDAQGAPLRMSGIATDVTERRLAEAEAREARWRAERRSEAHQTITRILAGASTLDDAMVPVLQAICELKGWDLGALWLVHHRQARLHCAGMWLRPGVKAERFAAVTREISFDRLVGLPGRVWASGEPVWVPDVTLDSNFPRREQASMDHLRSAFALPIIRQGAVAGVIELFSREAREPDREILNMFGSIGSQFGEFLERIEATDALRSSERRMRQVVDTSLDGIISIDGSGRIVDWNAQSVVMFGWTRDEVVGRPIEEVIIPEGMREAHRRGMAHYHATGAGPVLNTRVELDALRRNGQTFPIELAIAVVQPRGGDATGTSHERSDAVGATMFSAFVRDISERRQSERALLQAKEAAEEAAEARSEFVAMMSHEIRTPLNGVIGMLNLALKSEMSPEQHEQLRTARRSADLLLEVTNDVLDFSKIQAGRLVLEETPFDLAQLVDDVIGTVRPQTREGVRLSASIEGGVPPLVVGDPWRLRQVLVNLVGNATKFTTRGQVDLRVTSASEGTGQGARFCFTVEDTGIGIPADQHQTVFHAFTQADRSTTRRFGGTGLGLPIAARLADLMKGTLRLVRSSPQGSVFELQVPLRVSLAVRRAETVAEERRTVSGHILVVDDNRVNRDIAAAMVRYFGCTADLAEDGLEALSAIERTRYDLILMDCQMPEMDGYEATRALRARGITPEQLPVVAMTAGAMPEDRARALAAGMNDYLTKPLLEEPLGDILVRWTRRGLPPEAARPDGPGGPADGESLDNRKIERTRELMRAVPGAWETLVESFIHLGREAMDNLAQAAATRDFQAVGRIAHNLKGSAGMIGAPRLSRLASSLEQEVMTHSAPDCAGLVDAIRKELVTVFLALQTEPS